MAEDPISLAELGLNDVTKAVALDPLNPEFYLQQVWFYCHHTLLVLFSIPGLLELRTDLEFNVAPWGEVLRRISLSGFIVYCEQDL